MTNREYQHKQHRGSSPSRNADTGFTRSDGILPPEEWKNLTWYPVSSTPSSVPPEQSAAKEKK
ncbi:MAG: hypothetical protein WCI84_03765 [Bacteroidota bacterium]